jgi:hypothetical protein
MAGREPASGKGRAKSEQVVIAEICETPGFPIVYGESWWPSPYGPGLWPLWCAATRSYQLGLDPPFEPVIKTLTSDSCHYAHPVPVMIKTMYIRNMEYMTANNDLPCNVKFMIEGGEEVEVNP